MTELKLGEDYLNVEHNVHVTMFKVIRSNRSNIQIWQIFDLCSKTPKKLRLIGKLSVSFRKTVSMNLMAMSEFSLEAQKQQVSVHVQYIKVGQK